MLLCLQECVSHEGFVVDGSGLYGILPPISNLIAKSLLQYIAKFD